MTRSLRCLLGIHAWEAWHDGASSRVFCVFYSRCRRACGASFTASVQESGMCQGCSVYAPEFARKVVRRDEAFRAGRLRVDREKAGRSPLAALLGPAASPPSMPKAADTETRLAVLVRRFMEGHQHRKAKHRILCPLCVEARDLLESLEAAKRGAM